MKKILLIILTVFMLVGCDNMNTPTKRTEEYLSRYKTLEADVTDDIDLMIETENMSDQNEEIYRKVLKRELEDLKYEILSEEINGDEATVTVKITVYDLNKSRIESEKYYNDNTSKFYNNGVFDNDKYTKYRLEEMLKYDKTVEYTIKLNIVKTGDVWTVDEVDKEVKEKIYGLYDYES